MDRLPLVGIRIVDFTWAVAGPHCTRLLADMGAEVIKIESHARTDGMRLLGPFSAQTGPGLNKACAFNIWNRNKLGLTVDLSKPKGVELIKELIKKSDVVINNFNPGVMDRLGLDYSAVNKVKPDIIYVNISGFGNSGPQKNYVAYGIILSYLSGIASITGYLDDGAPRNIGTQYCDIAAGVQAAFAILAALHHRFHTGEGQEIDVSMWETATSLIPQSIMDYVMNGRAYPIMENREGVMAPCGCYRCKGEDKWVSIAVSTDQEWKVLCDVMGNPEWTSNEKFRDSLSRLKNQDELDRLIQEWTGNYGHIELMHMLQKAGVSAGASLTSEELLTDIHLNERGCWATVTHPEVGDHTVTGIVWKLSETPGRIMRPAPMFGEHNEYVFRDLLGMEETEVAKLVEEQIIY